MSVLSRAAGFFVVSLLPMAHDKLGASGGSKELFHAVVTTGVISFVFAFGGVLGGLIAGKQGRAPITEIIFGAAGGALAWALLFSLRQSAAGGPVSPWAQLGIVFGVGAVVVLALGRETADA